MTLNRIATRCQIAVVRDRFGMICALALLGAGYGPSALANDGKVTFINSAQKAGKVNATIHYMTPSGKCQVTSAITHPKGETAANKATQLAADISAQCVNAIAVAAGGTVTISSAGGKTLTEIDIDDKTNQKKTINPNNLDNGKKSVCIQPRGFGTGGTAMISMDGCGSTASTSVAGKSGGEVAVELAALLTNCDAASGSTIVGKDLGNGGGEICFNGLSNMNSQITFDGGGEFGFEDKWIVYTVAQMPTVSEWGLVVLTLLGLTVGTVMFGIRRRHRIASS